MSELLKDGRLDVSVVGEICKLFDGGKLLVI
jgi:hypothetical protein